jgi:hypothetical protein
LWQTISQWHETVFEEQEKKFVISLYTRTASAHIKKSIKIKSSPEACCFFLNEQQADKPLVSICSVYDFLYWAAG